MTEIWARVTTDETSREIVIELTGPLPDLENRFSAQQHRRSPVLFRPKKAVVTITDGVPFEIRVSGPIVSNGVLSTLLTDHDRWSADDIVGAPVWVRVLWNEAPLDRVRWTFPVEGA